MPSIAAIFDLDNTLLNDASGRLFFQYLRRSGEFSHFFRLRNVWTVASAALLLRLGIFDLTQAMRRSAAVAAGTGLDEMDTVVRRWFEEMVVHHISVAGRERLDWHRMQEHIPVICSGASQFSVLPVARYLGIEHNVHTEWLSKDGYLTGDIRQPIVYGAGKVYWMQKWAAEHKVNLAQSYWLMLKECAKRQFWK